MDSATADMEQILLDEPDDNDNDNGDAELAAAGAGAAADGPARPRQQAADLTVLIERVQSGDAGAREALYAAAYPELRQLARARLRDGGGRHPVMGTTDLVNESYLRFLGGCLLQNGARRAFFAYVSQVMRSVIVDALRERQAQRRGGDWEQVTLDTLAGRDVGRSGEAEVLEVHEALAQLAAAEPRLAEVWRCATSAAIPRPRSASRWA